MMKIGHIQMHSVCVCVCERERESVCVCMCVREAIVVDTTKRIRKKKKNEIGLFF